MERLYTKDINCGAVCDFIKKCLDIGVNPRAFELFKGGETLLSAVFAPYSFNDKMHLYSLSKAFTSCAVGIACDLGILSVDERIIDIFPDKCPAEISENLASMKLSHLLSMTGGHGECCMYKMRFSDDGIRTFLEQPVVYKPGEVFIYSTASTCICGAAVEKRSGMALEDFLYQHLLSSLDIEKPYWVHMKNGLCSGGTGLHLSVKDVSKFGQMLLGGGVYNQKRLISQEWINEATKTHSVDKNNGSPDWIAGYGYQFWMNARGGYRGDGAFGQLCVVIPQRDLCFSYLCEAGGMQPEVDAVFELLDNVFVPDDSRKSELSELCETLYQPKKSNITPFVKEFYPSENPAGIKSIKFSYGNLLTLEFDTADGTEKLVCKNGEYVQNEVYFRYLSPSITMLDPCLGTLQKLSVFAAFEQYDDRLEVILRHIDTPHVQRWIFTKDEWNIKLFVGGLDERMMRLTNKRQCNIIN